MIQNPKGGGLSSAFGGGNQIMGARKTSDFLEKTTWMLAIILVSLALLSNFAIPRASTEEDQTIINEIRENFYCQAKLLNPYIDFFILMY